MTRRLSQHKESWPLKEPFQITGRRWTELEFVVVEIEDQGVVGRGEATGIFFLDDTAATIYADIRRIKPEIESGASREDLRKIMKPGGARNALDCALWDLECRQQEKSIWALTGVKPRQTSTVMTISIGESPDAMANAAAKWSDYPVLKVKLNDEEPIERIKAIRSARPDAEIIIDANQGFSPDILMRVLPEFAHLNVAMLEQPLPRGQDEILSEIQSPIPLCADESCMHLEELQHAAERYQMINIKLDKAGGLTEALDLAAKAKSLGLSLMVGNMFGSSLAMVPSLVIAQLCRFVDLDGPLLLENDRPGGLVYRDDEVQVPHNCLWGLSGVGAPENSKIFL